KDISSLVLLQRVKERLAENAWLIDNIDATVVAAQPKLKDFIDGIRAQLSQTLGIALGQVSVKASTSNQLGFAGRGEGIAAHAVALIRGEDK
ncbi:MAG: 2-C-methyl-D-erythritol 2,4-cyclodiphosphate synthase, partial [Dehalococcoidales bacterium]|nr:2-C-methyl-D-erythritol 2,4-cyclodiphosphate synthase [Dehalococcoidales bacterium]